MFEPIKAVAQFTNPDTPTTYEEVVIIMINMLSVLMPVLIGLGLFLFIWGIVKFLTAQGSEESVSIGKKRMFWGVIILFVMVSFWGIVQLLFSDFFSGPFLIPLLPE